ncbi:MAG: signal peptidase II [Candidatus Pacebacteria bacterium]|nr:signal peptidase II [Candidatus Paceibacterota bacterium]
MFKKNYDALFGFEIDRIFLFLILITFLIGISQFLKNRKDAAYFDNALALIFSGISSNILDRAHTGFIIDYINLSNIYIFNLADLAILLGAILFIWRIIKE